MSGLSMPTDADPRLEAAEALAAAISAAHFALAALMERIHGQGEVSSGRRAILLNLARLGPATVPALAAMRPVSRQYVQRLADALDAEDLIAKAPNPAHARSPLLSITEKGRARLAQMLGQERPILEELAEGMSVDEAGRMTAALLNLRERVIAIGPPPPAPD